MNPVTTHLKQIVYGGSDGIVTTFAVVAGFTGAGGLGVEEYGFLAVLLFGFANLFADASSMGLGDYLSNRSQRDASRNVKELFKTQITENPTDIKEKTVKLLKDMEGFEHSYEQLLLIFEQHPSLWIDFLLKYDQQMDEGDDHAVMSALLTFISFIIFGLIPLLPFLFMTGQVGDLFLYSIITTSIALILLGLLRWKVTDISVFRAVTETLFISGSAAAIAYIVGVIIGG